MDSPKLKIETEENLKLNTEEKKKAHPLLFMQQCMLYDQIDNPKINVHNLTRLYRYDKSKLDIPKPQRLVKIHWQIRNLIDYDRNA